MTTENRSNLLNHASKLIGASKGVMIQATAGFSLYLVHVYLPKADERHLTAKEAAETVKVGVEIESEGTAGAVRNVAKKLGLYLVKVHGKPGVTVEGQPSFWRVLDMTPSEAIDLTIADLRARGWDGSWRGLKTLVGIEDASGEKKTAEEKLVSAVKAAGKAFADGSIPASVISQAISDLNSLLHAPASAEPMREAA